KPRRPLETVDRLADLRRGRLQAWAIGIRQPSSDLAHRLNLPAHCLAVRKGQYAHHEIDRLNAVGAFVARQHPRVAQMLAAPVSKMKPIPPCTWMPSEATSTAISVANALATGVNNAARSLAACRSAKSWHRCERSIAAAVA